MRYIKVLLVISMFMFSPLPAGARMLALESGLFGASGGTFRLDIVDLYAGYDKWTWEDYDDTYEYIRGIQNAGIAYTLTDALEFSAGMQYMYWLQRVNNSETTHLAGWGQANACVKYCFAGFLTLGARYYYPTDAPERELGGGEDVKAFVVLDSETFYMTAGYVLTGGYTIGANDYDPGDVVSGGMGLKLGGDNLKLLMELRGTSFKANTYNGVTAEDSAGITIDVFPGILLNIGKLQIKLGCGIAVGGTDLFGIEGLTYETEDSRGPGTVPLKYHDVGYDLTPIVGISYSFGGNGAYGGY